MRLRVLVFCCGLVALWANSAVRALAQAPELNFNSRVERQSIEPQLAKDLQPIADWCRSVGHIDWADQTMGWHQERDLNRQFIFLPSENSRLRPTDPLEQEWFDQLTVALNRHAERVFELATKSSNAEAGAAAFQFLNEVLYYNPDHKAVRGMLGHRKTDSGWQVTSDRLKLKTATRSHPALNWKANEFLVVSTPHFNISSQASEAVTRQLAEQLERWQAIWQQVFFEYWNRPRTVARWIEGKSKYQTPPRKFDIVFFADREQYIDELKNWVKGIEESTGYYNDSTKTSYFFASEELNSWRHELTHQLFQETIRTTPAPFEDGFLWLGEGIAMYFESMSDFGPYVTLGGFESERLQYARIRRFREGFYVPLQELCSLQRKEFQLRGDLTRLYSQSAGITHMLMDSQNGAGQANLIQALNLLYKGKLEPETFEEAVRIRFEALDEQYVEFLKIRPEEVTKFLSLPATRTELALPAAKLSDLDFESIGQCHALKWLDLTANRVTGKQIEMLKSCQQLEELFLTNCAIDGQTLQALRQFEQLSELDLSGSSVSDSTLNALTNSGLTYLRMANTNVTDAGLQHLAGFNQLKLLDVSGSKVSEEGVAWLRSQFPDLTIKRE